MNHDWDDYDSQGRLIPCVYVVMRIDSSTDCEGNSTTELVTISSHKTREGARAVVRKGEDLMWTKVPLPTGMKLTKMTKEDEAPPSIPPDCESGVQ